MRKRLLADFTRKIRHVPSPIAERRAKAVRGGLPRPYSAQSLWPAHVNYRLATSHGRRELERSREQAAAEQNIRDLQVEKEQARAKILQQALRD